MKKRVSGRLSEIFSEVPPCGLAADVGCDHGYIGCGLLELGRCGRVVFSDVSAVSLAKAERLARRRGLSGRASFFCADGLSHLSERADCAVVAGLGGREISEIVCAHPEAASRFVLQPMKNGPELREALVLHGFRILSDRKIEDAGRFYDLIAAERGTDTLSPLERKYGRTNLAFEVPAFRKYLEKRRAAFASFAAGSGVSESARALHEAELRELGALLAAERPPWRQEEA